MFCNLLNQTACIMHIDRSFHAAAAAGPERGKWLISKRSK